jgi:calcineurin-like phosphoesterase family protein
MSEPALQELFLIEIRLGRTKWRIKRTTEEICRIFSIEQFAEKHPHITLFGPFSLKEDIPESVLIDAVETAAKPFGPVPFLINGYEMNQGLNGAVIAYRVDPGEELVELNERVGASVRGLASTINIWDSDPGQKWFHVTLANRLNRDHGQMIFHQIAGNHPGELPRERKDGCFAGEHSDISGDVDKPDPAGIPRPPCLDEDGLRITIIKGDSIISEYDLQSHTRVSMDSGARAGEWRQTLRSFRRTRGIELTSPRNSGTPDSYVISDFHLGHENIIKYCSRPFAHDDVAGMDRMLIDNWNYTVSPADRVYCLGDFCYKIPTSKCREYLTSLNGDIILVAGNHDAPKDKQTDKSSVSRDGIRFVLVHDPADSEVRDDAWIIHGHHHNNRLAEYPFINFKKRRINVSAEVTGYRPVSLTYLCNLIRYYAFNPNQGDLILNQSRFIPHMQ